MLSKAGMSNTPEVRESARRSIFSGLAGRLPLFLLMAGLWFAVGCHVRYDITLNGGTKIRGVTKPKLDPTGRVYVFKDATGQTNWVPAMRVSVIEPQEYSRAEKKNKVPAKKTGNKPR